MVKSDSIPSEEIRRLYWEENQSTIEIGNHYGVCSKVIWKIMKKNNIPIRSLKESAQLLNLKNPEKMMAVRNRRKIKLHKEKESQIMNNVVDNKATITFFDGETQLGPAGIPTTTRGKTIEKMEIKAEKELALPLTTIQARKNEVEQHIDLCNKEIDSMEKRRQELESNFRGILSGIHRSINKKQVELLDLSIQERNETKEKLLETRNDLVFKEGLLDIVIENKEIINSITDSIKQLKNINETIINKIMYKCDK